jgi:multiple sugar transport system substrate-binding protein
MSIRKVTRRDFLAGALAVTGSLLAACTPAAPGTQAQPAAEGGEEAAAPSQEAITLVFHSRLGSHADWHKSRIPLFEEQNPGLKLQVDELDGAEMYTKIYAMAASKTLGDVVWTYLNTTLEHVSRGVPLALDDIIAAEAFDTSVFWTSIIDVLTLDGKLYGIPNHGHYGTAVYYYNRNMYQEAGVAEPQPEWTVEELVDGAMKMTQPPEIWGFRAAAEGQEHIPSYLRIFGGDLLNPEGTKAMLLEEGSLQALKWLYDLRFTHQVDPCLCSTDTRNNFVAGKVGCYNWTPGYAAEFTKIPAEDWTFEWDATIGPVGPQGLRGSQVSGAAFCVTQNSAHPNEAFRVLDFFSTMEDGIEHVYGGAGSPGPRNDVWASERLNAFHPIYGITMEHYPDGPAPWYYPANGRTSEFITTMDNNLQAIWTEAIGFQEGVELTNQLLQEVLDNEPI